MTEGRRDRGTDPFLIVSLSLHLSVSPSRLDLLDILRAWQIIQGAEAE